MKCGGSSDVKEATPDIQATADKVKPQLEEKTGKKFDVYAATHFTSQVVAGTNYFIKIHVGNEEYIHARVFKPLPHTGQSEELHSYQDGKKKEHGLEYF